MSATDVTLRGTLLPQIWHPSPGMYAPARYRKPCRYEAFLPETVSDWSSTLEAPLAGVVSDAEARIHALNAKAYPALAPLARLLLRTESIASSKVEGLQVEVRALARAEAKQETGASIGRETAEILANIDAMQLAIEEAASPESLEEHHILAIHKALLQRTHPHSAGRFRGTQNWIGGNDYNPCGADFVPAPYENVATLMSDLVAFVNDDSIPPLVQAAIAHAQFETIHPFEDGNGRTGRALVQIVLRRRELAVAYVPPISVVIAADRERYIRGLTDFRESRDAEWIELFAVSAARAADLASSYLEEVTTLQEKWRELLKAHADPRADAAAWAIIDALPAHPVLGVSVAVASTGRSRPAIGQGIEQLVAAGVLSPIFESKRNRAWEAPELLDLLSKIEE